ncbi:conserved hypothetical protein [Histoplasma capsulatum G186AR]|uniref:Importin N-terminal domain-containing protein n=2 Tax=Ajellomyces capsulatus TaxID=5037 RepID=C0NPC7_AJECG|nr:uncharacterized protein HCBG_05007 [Histoplasma capsulatum G186AR]EEH06787.1 conserved hypothetical protein [Histoplasma capsulatum G186AR]
MTPAALPIHTGFIPFVEETKNTQEHPSPSPIAIHQPTRHPPIPSSNRPDRDKTQHNTSISAYRHLHPSLVPRPTMEQQLLQLLADTQSPAPATRNTAEVQILTLYTNESFPLCLASIASHKSVPIPLRQSALLVLRTFVLAAWSPHLEEFKGQVLINNANKAQLRRVLFDLATSADADERKVKASASYVVSKIASADFPEEWPELLPGLLQIIPNSSDVQLHGALRVLSDLVESGFSEEQFFSVARDLVSTVFAVATNPARKPVLRALAVSVFRACFDTLEMVIEQHKVAVKQFLDEALNGWSPFFIATMKEPLPATPSEEEEVGNGPGLEEWRGWKLREAALFILTQLLRDFSDVDQQISLEAASGCNEFVRFCMAQEDIFLRARGYLVSGIIARTAGEGFHQTALSYLEASIKAISEDPSEVVQVSCIRVLQDFLPALPTSVTKPLQIPIITTLSEFLSSRDLREMLDSDDLKFTLLDTLRDAIMIDPSVVISSIALDVLFNIASNGSSNFQLATIVTETFEDVVQYISQQGPDAYIRLCEKVLPSLTGAIDVGNMTQENALTTLAADLIRALTEYGLEPLPQGLVANIMPKLNRLLLGSTEGNILPAATIAVKNMLQHDSTQFLSWQDPQTGKGAVEVVLIIIDHLLSQSVDDNAAEEVGGLAAELVEKAGSEKLGPYLTQLLHAVAHRLATAQKAQFIQSLILVFARLSLISAREVVDFLSTLTIDGQSGLTVVFSKWLENSITFAGYDEIRQNVIALSKIYQLDDPRVVQVQVKGELIIQDTGRIKTRSQARMDPDRYTIVSAPLKIIKVLTEELLSASGNRDMDAAAAAAAAGGTQTGGGAGSRTGEAEDDDDGENDDWEDVSGPDNVLDLGLGITKHELMGYLGEDGGVAMRQRDDETLAYLMGFFREVAPTPRFQELFALLNAREQEALRSLGQ